MTAEETRQIILEATRARGGHLASSLGAVELALALAEIFEPTKDRIVWDVGHQAYAWKIATGRGERFATLRQLDGLAPFPNPAESPADAAVAGHAGSALSVALGLAAARDARGTSESVVAVVGDASMANGHSFEALNNCAAETKKLIVVLNDNEMSISRPVGSLAKFLGRLITNVRYNRVKKAAEAAGHRLRLTFLRGVYHRIESRIKGLFLGNRFFEQFGLRYIGPVDGHDLAALCAALTVAREDKRSVLVHVVTKKGCGYAPAERNPTKYHGVSPATFAEEEGASKPQAFDAIHNRPDWSTVFGSLVTDLAKADGRVVALTAGMKDGTGLTPFAEAHPTRFHDVGIAEGHLVGFAAGLAAGGLRPVVAVYSTFLQRAVDQVMHDVCISSLPVVFCVDRAGVVGADGVTHQGVFDLAMLRSLPNLTICQPCDGVEFKLMLEAAVNRSGPTVIRYPRGRSPAPRNVVGEGLAVPVANIRAPVQLWVTGDWLDKALDVAEKTGVGVVYARYLKPFDAELLARQRAAGMTIVSLENGACAGGFGEAIGAEMRLGWPDAFIPHGSVAELERRYGLDVESVARRVATLMNGRN